VQADPPAFFTITTVRRYKYPSASIILIQKLSKNLPLGNSLWSCRPCAQCDSGSHRSRTCWNSRYWASVRYTTCIPSRRFRNTCTVRAAAPASWFHDRSYRSDCSPHCKQQQHRTALVMHYGVSLLVIGARDQWLKYKYRGRRMLVRLWALVGDIGPLAAVLGTQGKNVLD